MNPERVKLSVKIVRLAPDDVPESDNPIIPIFVIPIFVIRLWNNASGNSMPW
jgi:hypothetical protein